MQIINGFNVTYVSFNKDYTEATLTRLLSNNSYRVEVSKEYFTMQKLNHLTNIDNDDFKGLSMIQTKRKELEDEQVTR